MKGIQYSLFSFVIAEYHIIDKNWEAATELLSYCISNLRQIPVYLDM